MRSEQRSKLARYKAELAAAEKWSLMERQQRRLSEAVDKMTDAISNIVAPDSPVVNVTVDTDGITEAIKSIPTPPQPVIKVNVPAQEAPKVTVNVPNQDIYARYKRYNSRPDPEGTYHAFLDTDGNWFIQLESTMQNGTTDITRYAVGKGDISKAWLGRKRLNYKPLDKVNIL